LHNYYSVYGKDYSLFSSDYLVFKKGTANLTDLIGFL